MSSRFTTTQRSPALPKKPVANVIAAVPPAMQHAAADDKTRKSEFSIFGDPLWGIAIASAILFAAFAALMAVG